MSRSDIVPLPIAILEEIGLEGLEGITLEGIIFFLRLCFNKKNNLKKTIYRFMETNINSFKYCFTISGSLLCSHMELLSKTNFFQFLRITNST